MTKIPKDIRETAAGVYTDFMFHNSGGISIEEMTARAILAERERCAKIAVGMRGSYGGLVGTSYDSASGFDAACWQIEDAIRGGSNA